MSFRLTAAAPAIRSLLARPPTASSRQFVRRLAQNSTSHTHAKGGSDLPWIIGAVAFTIPSSLYLLSGSSKPAHHSPTSHGHAAAETAHAKKEDVSKAASETTNKVREKAGELYNDAKNKAPASATEAKDTAKDTATAVKEKSGEKAEDLKDEVKEKAKEYTSSKESSGQEKEAEPKEKKKPSDIDKPKAGEKESTSTNMQSGKQEGLSNDDTKHPVLNDEKGQAISKKSEGTHDTAKLKGTVDPSRDPK